MAAVERRARVVRVKRSDDPRLADYVGLTDVALRMRTEEPGGLFIAESALVVRRALAAGYRLRSALVSERWLPGLLDSIGAEPAPIYVGTAELLEQVTGFHVHRGALAVFSRKPLQGPDQVLHSARRVVVLEGVNTHTNVGAILRSAAALGADAVLLDPTSADPLYRRAVRVSMGAVFSLPWTRLGSWPKDLYALKDRGFRLLALTPGADAVPLPSLGTQPGGRVAVLLGAEGSGLSSGALKAADVQVAIPMSHGIDSLNVAAAAAVACYAAFSTAAGAGG